MKKPTKVIALFSVMVLSLASCTTAVHDDGEEPSPNNIINGTQTQVIKMPEGFRNIAFTCHGTVGLYVTSRGWVKNSTDANLAPLPSTVTAISDHPLCKNN